MGQEKFEQDYDNYLYIVKRVADEGSDMQDPESWSGGLTFMANIMKMEVKNLNFAIRKNATDIKVAMSNSKTGMAIKSLNKKFTDQNDVLRD